MSDAFQPPSVESEAEAHTEIDEEEYFNQALLNSQPNQQDNQQEPQDGEASVRRQAFATRLSSVNAPTLPTSCRVKRLGSAPAVGISGSASVRSPLDQLTRDVARRRIAFGGAPLPVVRLDVFQHGLGIADESAPAASFFPIETVSYAMMDTRMPRIFCIIAVEISAAGFAPVNPTCHAYLCVSVEACYRLVLALTTAFNSAVNRSKAANRRRRPAGAATGTAAAAVAKAGHRVVNLAFTGDHEDA